MNNNMNKEELYALAYDEGFKAGVESATEMVYARCYDEAFTEGYLAAKEELTRGRRRGEE